MLSNNKKRFPARLARVVTGSIGLLFIPYISNL
jgi:hypothetical protein